MDDGRGGGEDFAEGFVAVGEEESIGFIGFGEDGSGDLPIPRSDPEIAERDGHALLGGEAETGAEIAGGGAWFGAEVGEEDIIDEDDESTGGAIG